MIGFDYSQDAIYFVTSCCKNRIHHFGEIENSIMLLNKYGEIAHNQILWLETQYPYIELHNFIVMPNHVHILFEINRNLTVGMGRDPSQTRIKSVSSIMGAYKTTSSKEIHLMGDDNFIWQRSFHDYIVRDEKRYNNIFNYVNENPARWNEDVFNKKTNSNYNEDN